MHSHVAESLHRLAECLLRSGPLMHSRELVSRNTKKRRGPNSVISLTAVRRRYSVASLATKCGPTTATMKY